MADRQRRTAVLARGLTFCAAALFVHGALLWLFAATQSALQSLPDLVGEVLFWVLSVPALLLTMPFTSLLWKLGLMNAPGWFAWPKPLGLALAYGAWIAVLLVLAAAARRLAAR